MTKNNNFKYLIFLFLVVVLVIVGIFIFNKDSTPLQLQTPDNTQPVATIKTNMGDITVMFFPEQAPKTVENFLTHAKNGYYNGIIFHRVIKDFMIQGGDPTGTGAGGESIWGDKFEDEFSSKLFNIRGAISMANSGSNTNGSQFFIIQNTDSGFTEEVFINAGYPKSIAKAYAENGGSPHLDGKHTVFGQVIEGMDIVDKIASVEVDLSNPNSPKPVQDVVINSIEVKNY